MEIIKFLMFIFSTIGCCNVIVDGAIMTTPRNLFKKLMGILRIPKLGDVVDCYLCTGVWSGFLMGFIWLSNNILEIFACGCAGGFLCHFTAIIMNYIEAITVISLPDD